MYYFMLAKAQQHMLVRIYSFLYFFFFLLGNKEQLSSFKEFCFVSSINAICGCGVRSSWLTQESTFFIFVLRFFFSPLYCNLSKNNKKKKTPTQQCGDTIADLYLPSRDRAVTFALLLFRLLCFSKRHQQQEGQPTVNCSFFFFFLLVHLPNESRLAPDMFFLSEDI